MDFSVGMATKLLLLEIHPSTQITLSQSSLPYRLKGLSTLPEMSNKPVTVA